MTDEVKATVGTILERWGFPVLVALALGYILRADILLPMLEEHRLTLKEIRETQRSIAEAVTEQTKLLYAMQPRTGHAPVKVEARDP
jgi:hypothetical protein